MKRRDLFLATLIFIAAWQLLAMAIHRDTTTVVPTPFVVVRTFVAELPKELAQHFAVSAWRVLASIAVSIVLAVPAVLTALRLSVGTAVAVLYITKVLATQAGWGTTSPSRAARCSTTRRCTRARWRWRSWG